MELFSQWHEGKTYNYMDEPNTTPIRSIPSNQLQPRFPLQVLLSVPQTCLSVHTWIFKKVGHKKEKDCRRQKSIKYIILSSFTQQYKKGSKISKPRLSPHLTRENQHFHEQSKNQKVLHFGTPVYRKMNKVTTKK